MNNWLQRFMAGRYGPDRLGRALMVPGYAFWILGLLINLIFGKYAAGYYIGTAFYWIGFVFIAYQIFRMLSRNIYKRRAENDKYLAFYSKNLSGIATKINTQKNHFKQRKQYKFVRCPSCGTVGRIPRGRGSITITCTSCRHEFHARS